MKKILSLLIISCTWSGFGYAEGLLGDAALTDAAIGAAIGAVAGGITGPSKNRAGHALIGAGIGGVGGWTLARPFRGRSWWGCCCFLQGGLGPEPHGPFPPFLSRAGR